MVTEKRFRALERRVTALETDKKKLSQEKNPDNKFKALIVMAKSRQIPLYARDVLDHWEEVDRDDLDKLEHYLEILIDCFNLALPETIS